MYYRVTIGKPKSMETNHHQIRGWGTVVAMSNEADREGWHFDVRCVKEPGDEAAAEDDDPMARLDRIGDEQERKDSR